MSVKVEIQQEPTDNRQNHQQFLQHFNRKPYNKENPSKEPNSPLRSDDNSKNLTNNDSIISGVDIYNSQIGGNNSSVISNHYEVPNLASMLYEYTNNEMDRVKYSFRIGNFYSLRDLPRHLLPGNVSTVSKSKIESNLYSQI